MIKMPGVHKYKTLSFRPSDWEREMIEKKAELSGVAKKDFIAKSCIYSNICVVGNEKNIQRIVDVVEEMSYTMKELSSGIATGEFPVSGDAFKEMAEQYLITCNVIVEILDGASYLFGHKFDKDEMAKRRSERVEQLLHSLGVLVGDEGVGTADE